MPNYCTNQFSNPKYQVIFSRSKMRTVFFISVENKFRLSNLDIDQRWLSISTQAAWKIYSGALELCQFILLKQSELPDEFCIHDDSAKDNLSYRSVVQKKQMFLSQKRICFSVWCKGGPPLVPGLLFLPSRNVLRASWNSSSEPFSIGLFLYSRRTIFLFWML